MIVRKTMLDVSRRVICRWRFVCGERGRGTESCWGWSVGEASVAAAVVDPDGECERELESGDADMMRGMSDVERYMLKSARFEQCSSLLQGMSFTTLSPTLLRALERQGCNSRYPFFLLLSPFVHCDS